MEGQPRTETLDVGREPLGDALQGWARRHPWLAVPVAVAVLVAAGAVAVRVLQSAAPQLGVVSGPVADPWEAGWDGRPRSAPVLAVTATVHRTDGGRDRLLVTGADGPGLGPPLAAPVAVPPTGT